MSPITHYLASWTLATHGSIQKRDIAIVTWVGTLPDLDGLGILADISARLLGAAESDFYLQYHHRLLHGFFGALLLSLLTLPLFCRKKSVFFLSLAAIHLHFLFDLVGSRGHATDEIWSIPYLAPFSAAWDFSWAGQWPLNGWQNMLITLLLLMMMFYKSIKFGDSAIEPISTKAHQVLVKTLQNRWKR